MCIRDRLSLLKLITSLLCTVCILTAVQYIYSWVRTIIFSFLGVRDQKSLETTVLEGTTAHEPNAWMSDDMKCVYTCNFPSVILLSNFHMSMSWKCFISKQWVKDKKRFLLIHIIEKLNRLFVFYLYGIHHQCPVSYTHLDVYKRQGLVNY